MARRTKAPADNPAEHEDIPLAESSDDVIGSRDERAVYPKDVEDLRCGIGNFRPRCLQVFNNPQTILCCLFAFSFTQGFLVNGLNNLNTPILERRFELTSSKAGVISSSYDISATLLSLPISYYGAHAHQPRMLSLASLLMACGSFIMVVPHFGTGLYNLKESQADECVIGFNTTEFCMYSGSVSKLSYWLGVFILSMILIGIAGTTLHSLGIAFLESSVSPHAFPFYQGVFFSGVTLGPSVGFLAGGYIIQNYYVDVDKVDPSSLDLGSEDPRYIGAWWMGIIASGFVLFLVTLSLMCFPRELPGAKELGLKRQDEVHQAAVNEIASRNDFGRKWRDMPLALKLLFSNPVFICLSLVNAFQVLSLTGMGTFMPKYVQNQFALTLGKAAVVSGLVVIPGALCGQIAGGLICRLAKLKVKGMLKLCIYSTLAALLLSFLFLIRCPTPPFAGINRHYENTTELLTDVNLHSECNSDCGCTTLSYEPICGINNVQYFSACHAGCQKAEFNGSKTLINCSCIDGDMRDEIHATSGFCELDRANFIIFMALLFILTFITFLRPVPSVTVTIRCIPINQRTFGIGVQWVVARVLGAIPGPIFVGYLFDGACRIWQENCDVIGACWVYDTHALAIRVLLINVFIKTLSIILYIIAIKLYKPPTGGNTRHEKDPLADDHKDEAC